MTSASFHIIPLSSIIIEREARQRRDLPDLSTLAESISRLGLIHPPVITRDSVLVAGERRLEACRSLGWTDIPIQYTDEVEPSILRSIELEENIKRVDISWQDRCRAVEEFNAIRKAGDPSWTQDATATALGLTPSTVTELCQVAAELRKGTPTIVAAPKFSVARGILARRSQRAAANEVETFKAVLAEKPRVPDVILNTSFLDWAETYSGPKFNLIHCDFPYGIGADGFNQGSASAHGGYDDSPDVYWRLLSSLCRNLDRIALPSCHLVFWYSMKYHTETVDALRRNTDFVVDDFPLVWLKSDNAGALPDPERGPRRIYETALFAYRGDRRVVGAVANAYAAPTDRSSRTHMSFKPEPVLRHFFRMLVDEHSRVLDPTCGSGGALRVADGLGADAVLGLEINSDFAKAAQEDFVKARELRSVK